MVWWLAVAILHALLFVPHPRDYHSAVVDQLSPETSVLVLGTSHVMFGLVPDRFGPDAVVVSAGAMNFESMELVAEYALARAPNIQTALIECDILPLRVDTLSKYNGDFSSLYALGVGLNDLPRNPYWKLKQALRESRGLYPIFFMPRMNPRGWLWSRRWKGEKQQGQSMQMLTGRGKLEGQVHEGNDGRVVVGFHRADMRPDYSNENTAALMRMIRHLESQGIQVVLFRLPHHTTYLQAQPEEWEQQIRALVASIHSEFPRIPYGDFKADPEYGDADFADGHHLNGQGAERFSDQLDAWLAPLLRQEGP